MPARSPSPDPEAASRVWRAMSAFVAAHDRRDETRAALGLGLGSGRVQALRRLAGGPLTLSELAEAHGIDAPYATLVVDKLEALGLVERRPHPEDRRRKLVALTPAGVAAVDLADAIDARPPDRLAGLDAADLDRLDRLLTRLGSPDS